MLGSSGWREPQAIINIPLERSATRSRGSRTRAEQAASPDRYLIDSSNGERKPIHLNPATRVRSAVSYQRDEIVDDLITLLRRQSKGGGFR
jgi:hypothetical protein